MKLKIFFILLSLHISQLDAYIIANGGQGNNFMMIYDSTAQKSAVIGGWNSADSDNDHCVGGSNTGAVTLVVPENLKAFGQTLASNSNSASDTGCSPMCLGLAAYIFNNYAVSNPQVSVGTNSIGNSLNQAENINQGAGSVYEVDTGNTAYCSIVFQPKDNAIFSIDTSLTGAESASSVCKGNGVKDSKGNITNTTSYTCSLIQPAAASSANCSLTVNLQDIVNSINSNLSTYYNNFVNAIENGTTASQPAYPTFTTTINCGSTTNTCIGTATTTSTSINSDELTQQQTQQTTVPFNLVTSINYVCQTSGLQPNYTLNFNVNIANPNPTSVSQSGTNNAIGAFLKTSNLTLDALPSVSFEPAAVFNTKFNCGFCGQAERNAMAGSGQIGSIASLVNANAANLYLNGVTLTNNPNCDNGFISMLS